ncbi:hypothetical protein [Serratia marcescens]|jgi:ribosomal-protein-alanine N-acetyltransferase|uniref:hypothetical protein n=1 Tax=Serratia marcescens TaxID=615 RepID=UPI0027E574D9|nr:hypothetical protein [Serratia marcescens]
MTVLPTRILLPDELDASLRPLVRGDVDAWSAYLSQPGVTEHTSWGDVGPTNLAQLVSGYAAGRDALRWAIVDSNDRLLGTVG